ncbi:MAG: 3-methyladenine DNA glycosylase, partial [Pseudomonadota bacterium]
MRSFDQIFDIAAERHGGAEALDAKLDPPPPIAEVAAQPDDRWLSMMTRAIFQAGFSWKVIEAKWDGFEAAFEGFD